MKKLLLTTAAGLAFFASGPANAEIVVPRECTSPVCAHVDFDKKTWVYELQLKLKVALIVVAGVHAGPYAAESNVVVFQQNKDSDVSTNGNIPGPDTIFNLEARIDDSVRNNRGIAQFNQDVGNSTNQSNVLSIAVNRNGGFADSNASVQQDNTNNITTSTGVIKNATIINSVNNNSGVTMVNQNAGNFNNQANVMSAAISGTGADSATGFTAVTGPKGTGTGTPGGAVLALSEADLGQSNYNNTTREINIDAIKYKDGLIQNSVNSNTGVTAVNQSVGNFNNQATVISLSGVARF